MANFQVALEYHQAPICPAYLPWRCLVLLDSAFAELNLLTPMLFSQLVPVGAGGSPQNQHKGSVLHPVMLAHPRTDLASFFPVPEPCGSRQPLSFSSPPWM